MRKNDFRIGFRVSEELFHKVNAICQVEKCSKTELFVSLILEKFTKNREYFEEYLRKK